MHRIRLIGGLHTFFVLAGRHEKTRPRARLVVQRVRCFRVDLSSGHQAGRQRKHRIGHVHFDGLTFGLGKHAALDH